MSMITKLNNKKTNYHKKFKYKFLNSVKANLFYLCIIFLSIFMAVNVKFYNSQLENIKPAADSIFNKLSINILILGILLGYFLALFSINLYQEKSRKKNNKAIAKNYARIFKADLERSSRLFKNKRFFLMKISRITIMKNWLEAFGYISGELTNEEIKELVNYYSQIDKLNEYEKKINQHLEAMQCTVLKDYPHMREYKELIAAFTFELNNLFKVDISLLGKKLELLCRL